MAESPLILAADLGTSGCKTALVTTRGEVLAWAFEPVDLLLLPGGGAEQRPDDWWNAFTKSARQILDAHDAERSRVVAVCFSTQGEGTVAVDAEGCALRNGILWLDSRGAPYVAKQCRGLVNVEGYGALKLKRWIQRTGGAPSLTGKDNVGHMLWLKHEEPETFAQAHKFLNVLDYMNHRLTGRFVASHDSILTTWATDNRDGHRVCFDETLLKWIGVPREKLPEIVPCTEVIGALSAEAADALGLAADVKVVAGSIDTSAAAIGSGASDDFAVHIYLGTSSWLAAHVPFKKTDIFRSIASVPGGIPGRWLMIAMQTTAGGNLTFLRDNILYHKDALLQESEAPDVYKLMDEIVASTPPGSNGVIYTPWIYGERSPIEDSNVRAAFMNLSLENTRSDMVRAMYEGIALNTRWMLEPVEKFLGRPVGAINLIGGGATSDAWCQIFADVFGRPVRQMAEPIQANVRGSAFIAGVALGLLRFEDVPALVEVKAEYTPNPEAGTLYAGLFRAFQEIYKGTKGVYRRLNG